MVSRIHASVAMAIALTGSAVGFSPNAIKQRAFTTPRTAQHHTALNLQAVYDNEEDAMYLMRKASECAHSDTCSIEDAQFYLREVVHVQSGCVAGTLAGQQLCDDVSFATEVVADLRAKIEQGAKATTKSFWDQRQDEFERLAVASMNPDGSGMSPTAALTKAPIRPGYLALAALYGAVVITMVNMNAGVDAPVGTVPFTPQEWMWAIRDGYVPDMAAHFLRNGGLLVSDTTQNVDPSGTVPFTPQEWLWAMRDGYMPDMASHFFRNGGLLVSDASQNGVDSGTPFTPQEIWWAARDGYLFDIVKRGGF